MSKSIKIILQALSDNITIKSTRGIVCLVLKDATVTGLKEYKNKKQIKEGYSAENKKLIERCFDKYGVYALKVACYAENISEALDLLKDVKFNYLACTATDKNTEIVSFIKEMREQNELYCKAVLNNQKADYEGIINFKNTKVTDADGAHTGAEYCIDVACILATMSWNISLTNYKMNDVIAVEGVADWTECAESGEVCLYYDNDLETFVFSDGVNSKTSIKEGEKEVLKKIRIVDIFDMVREYIRIAFKENYRGKTGNSYNNRKLIRDSYNIFFRNLQKQGVLNPDKDCYCWLDVDATRDYLESKSIDTSNMTDEEVLKEDIGKKIFLRGRLYALDTIEELEFVLNY